MQEPLDNQNLVAPTTWGQRNPVWAGLLSAGLLFLAYFAFTIWIMDNIFPSMRNSMQQNGTVLISDGTWLKVWNWSSLAPLIIPTFVTLFIYRFKRKVVLYFDLVKRGWLVTSISILLIYAMAALFFKAGNFIPIDNKALKLLAAITVISLVALVVNLILSIFFRKSKL